PNTLILQGSLTGSGTFSSKESACSPLQKSPLHRTISWQILNGVDNHLRNPIFSHRRIEDDRSLRNLRNIQAGDSLECFLSCWTCIVDIYILTFKCRYDPEKRCVGVHLLNSDSPLLGAHLPIELVLLDSHLLALQSELHEVSNSFSDCFASIIRKNSSHDGSLSNNCTSYEVSDVALLFAPIGSSAPPSVAPALSNDGRMPGV